MKLAAWIGRSRRADRQILEDVDIPWGHQVAVMFQVVCALALEVPEVLLKLRCLNGVSPNVVLACEPWGHIGHCNEGCECLSFDRTVAYVHDLSLASCDILPVSGEPPDAVPPALTGIPDVHGVDYMWDLSTRVLGTCGRYPLCPRDQGLTAGCSWPCTCGGRRDCWWHLIGCDLLRGGLACGCANHSGGTC